MPDPSQAARAADHQLAAELAEAAGELLLRLRAEANGDGDALSRRADLASNALLLGRLAQHRPLDAVLSEESVDDGRRFEAERCWIIDPLDGSREFGEHRDDWAVHVALVRDHVVIAGAVALPARGVVLSTGQPQVDAPPPARAVPRIVVSRTRPPAVATDVAHALRAELVEMGSAGAKAGAVLLGEADAYIHAGGQSEWDSAAPVGVSIARGLHASRLDGSPLVYNQVNPSAADLVICRADLAAIVLEALRVSSQGRTEPPRSGTRGTVRSSS